ncbi:MAG TPA: branched-chain amino acid ABC transporter permease [Ktedonobacteraceae bacterium]
MKKIRTLGLLALLALLLAFPLLFPDPAVTTIAIFTLLYAGATTAWNIFSGYTGYVSLGSAVFYGVGGYALALLCKGWNIQGGYMPFLLLPLVGLIASVFAIPLGWLALRSTRHVFVVITIAMFYIFQLLAYNLPGITNGSTGMFLPSPPWDAAFFNTPFYYVSLIVLLFSIGVSWWVRNSKYGLGLLAIRDDEDRALSLGVKAGASKLVAYVISAFFIGMIGALVAYFIGSLYPEFAFTPVFDITVALMAFLGGVGTLAGPLVGALLLAGLQQYLTVQLQVVGLDLILFGALLLVVILLLPEGIVPTLRRRWVKWTASRSATPPVAGTRGKEQALLVKGGRGGKR